MVEVDASLQGDDNVNRCGSALLSDGDGVWVLPHQGEGDGPEVLGESGVHLVERGFRDARSLNKGLAAKRNQ